MAAHDNLLLESLPRRDCQSLVAASEPIELTLGSALARPGGRTRHVYFPHDAFVSLVIADGEACSIEVGLVGREGMLGGHLTLGADASPWHAIVQGAGQASRVATGPFRRELASSPALRATLAGYLHVVTTQLATATLCTRFHRVEPRLARWLLMTQDRARSSEFHLTHEFLSGMLGVRRVGITGAASHLQRLGLIRYRRGDIVVLDRPGLEAAACSCYAADRRAYVETLG